METALNLSTLDFQTSTPLMLPKDTMLVRTDVGICRDRYGHYPQSLYNIITCALCFKYVYNELNVTLDSMSMHLVTGTNTAYPEGTKILPDPFNQTSYDLACGLLWDKSQCWRWKDCCTNASNCCKRQLEKKKAKQSDQSGPFCPQTWDGYACFSDTPPGRTVPIQCPAYIPDADTDYQAYKKCTANGTWYISPDSGIEWTDYVECHNFEEYKRLHAAGVICNSITIALLVPACIIFLYFRPLRLQHRIRLHICLMVSSMAQSLGMLLWEIIVFRDRLNSQDDNSSVVHQNSIACRMLNLSTRCSLIMTFMWMVIEGFHLHRLLVHAFTVPKSLVPYYLFGFGFPLLPTIIYAAIRVSNEEYNQKCWTHQAGDVEWMLYAPILAVLVINVVFLSRIVYIMVRQLAPHPNEPSTYRRAAKAVGVLVPLFGVQFVLFVYRPKGDKFAQIYELTYKIVSSLQGSFIAIVFCYGSREVQDHLKNAFKRMLWCEDYRRNLNTRGASMTMMSQVSTEPNRSRCATDYGETNHMIPMYPMEGQTGKDTECHSKNHDYKANNDTVRNGPEGLNDCSALMGAITPT